MQADDTPAGRRPSRRAGRLETSGIGQNVADIFASACQLLSDRLELLQHDVREGGKQLGQRAVFWALAGLFALGVLIAGSVSLALGLRPLMGDALAAASVAGAHAVLAAFMVHLARRPRAAGAADSEALMAPPPAAGR